MRHLIDLVEELRQRGVGFKSLCDGVIDTTTASGELVFHIFTALAQFERRLIQERTNAGLAAARARGRKGGRKPMPVNDPRVQTAKKIAQRPEYACPGHLQDPAHLQAHVVSVFVDELSASSVSRLRSYPALVNRRKSMVDPNTYLAILAVIAGGEKGGVRELRELRRTVEGLKADLAKAREEEATHRGALELARTSTLAEPEAPQPEYVAPSF